MGEVAERATEKGKGCPPMGGGMLIPVAMRESLKY